MNYTSRLISRARPTKPSTSTLVTRRPVPTAPSDPFGAENVWTNNYDARHQLGEDPTASAPQFTIVLGMGTPPQPGRECRQLDVVDGQIGQAIDLDGDDGATFDTDFAYPGLFTASMWWNSSGDGFAISVDAGMQTRSSGRGPVMICLHEWSQIRTLVRLPVQPMVRGTMSYCSATERQSRCLCRWG